MKTYNHMFTVAFSIPGSTTEDGSDISNAQYLEALIKRAIDLYEHDEFEEALGGPDDTYQE